MPWSAGCRKRSRQRSWQAPKAVTRRLPSWRVCSRKWQLQSNASRQLRYSHAERYNCLRALLRADSARQHGATIMGPTCAPCAPWAPCGKRLATAAWRSASFGPVAVSLNSQRLLSRSRPACRRSASGWSVSCATTRLARTRCSRPRRRSSRLRGISLCESRGVVVGMLAGPTLSAEACRLPCPALQHVLRAVGRRRASIFLLLQRLIPWWADDARQGRPLVGIRPVSSSDRTAAWSALSPSLSFFV